MKYQKRNERENNKEGKRKLKNVTEKVKKGVEVKEKRR